MADDAGQEKTAVGPEVTKASIRKETWDYLEKNNLAKFPRPVHHRIPNFKGSDIAADKVCELDEFQKAKTIEVNPDKPQEEARFKVLEAEKTLLVPTPRLSKGLFNKIEPPDTNKSTLRLCSSSRGVREHSSPIGLEDTVKVDLIIIGSVAVSKEGYRLGKGEGYADMEWAMMATMGAVNENTMVISTVHDCQVKDIPSDLMGPHDLPVDMIVTPTQIISCPSRTKPTGIMWSMIDKEKLKRMPVLKLLRVREREAGKDVTLKDGSNDPEDDVINEEDEEEDTAESPGRRRRRIPRSETVSVFVGGIPRGIKIRDFKDEVRKHDAQPITVQWRSNHAFLVFENKELATAAVESLQGLKIMDREVTVEMSTGKKKGSSSEEGEVLNEKDMNTNHEDGDGRRGRGRKSPGRSPRRRRRFQPQRTSLRNIQGSFVYVGDIPNSIEKPADLRDKLEAFNESAAPKRVIWHGRRRTRYAFLVYDDLEEATQAVESLKGFSVDDEELKIQLSSYAERKRNASGSGDENAETGEESHDEGHEDNRRRRGGPRRGYGGRRYRGPKPSKTASVYVGSLPGRLRVSDFKKDLHEKDVHPLQLIWRGHLRHAFLVFETMEEANTALKNLEGMVVNEREIKVEMSQWTAKRQHTHGAGDDIEAHPQEEITA